VTPSSGVPFRPGVVLTPLDGGATLTLGPNSYIVDDAEAGLVVGVQDPDPQAAPTIELVDVATGAIARSFAGGYPLGANGHDVIMQGTACNPQQTVPPACILERVDVTTGNVTSRYPLPAGRAPTSNAVFSADGRLIAFQLIRASQDPRFATDHPAPPSDLAILHLDTGRLEVVPNLEFAPKTSASLAFDAASTSLLAAINEGDFGELLIWQSGMTAPALVETLPGPLDAPPPLLVERR
jgi:hypothetical protein